MPELHDYQKTAVAWLRTHPRGALWLEMGLGKTCVVLTALQAEDLPALVIAPRRIRDEVWPVEVPLWRPDLRVDVAVGTPKARAAILANPRDIVVLGRDVVADAMPHARKYRTIVIDESSGFKSVQAKRWKVAMRLATCPSVRRVWELTGTPSPNGYLDIWPQIAILDQGERLGRGSRFGTGITKYRERYFTPGRQLRSGVITEWNLRPGAAKRINRLLEDIVLSMTVDGRIDLPPLTHNIVRVPLPPAVQAVYRKMSRDLIVNMETAGLGKEIHTASNAATLTNRLSQITAGFMYVDDADLRGGAYEELHRAKAEAVREIVDGTGSPVLVAYRYKAERDMLLREIPEAVTIDAPNAVRRWNAGQIPVLLVHPASAGHGLNLQEGGHTLVWVSGTWSLEEFDQTNARLYRQNQKQPVVIHHLVCPGTVDEAIKARVVDKKSVQDALMAYLESPV